jgi:hypothetical protein
VYRRSKASSRKWPEPQAGSRKVNSAARFFNLGRRAGHSRFQASQISEFSEISFARTGLAAASSNWLRRSTNPPTSAPDTLAVSVRAYATISDSVYSFGLGRVQGSIEGLGGFAGSNGFGSGWTGGVRSASRT